MNEKEIKEIAEKAVKAVMAELRLDEQKKTVWKPQKNERYFCFDSEGITFRSNWEWEDDSVDLKRLAIGNVFKTELQAQLKIEKMKLEAEIDRWIKENDPEALELDWNDDDCWKYCAMYSYNDKCFTAFASLDMQSLNEYYFSSKNKAEAFIVHFGDRLKLLLRGKVD